MELQIDKVQIKKAQLVLRAINHPLRQKLLQLIHVSGRITVTGIYIKLRLEQSVASQHLAILRYGGFVNTTREGKFIYYSINYKRIHEVETLAASLLQKQIQTQTPDVVRKNRG
jgi:DNA-binding transcriptional ArsR family regulator